MDTLEMQKAHDIDLLKILLEGLVGQERLHPPMVYMLLTMHRTNQQYFAEVCLRWFYALAEQMDSGNYDLRNEQSSKIGSRIRDLLGPEGYRLFHG